MYMWVCVLAISDPQIRMTLAMMKDLKELHKQIVEQQVI